jgi:predicted phosphodiesterase
MKIGVLSDSHADSFAQLHEKILLALLKVDLIIHAGDFVAKDVLDGLKQLSELKAVWGIHGWGSPHGIDDRVGNVFSGVDIIIYGHSHYPQNETRNGVYFFNPGQARNSFGILTVGAEISGEIIKL